MTTPAALPPTDLAHGVVRRIYGNLGKLMGGKAIAGIISLAYMMLAIRVLGARDYGVLILVHAYTVMVGGLIEFPGWHAVVRYGAQATRVGDSGRLLRLLRLAGIVELSSGALAFATAALLAPVIGPRLGWTPTAIAFATPYSLAVLATIRSAPAGYLQLVGRFDLLGIHNVVAPTVRLMGALIAFATGGGLHAFLVAWLAAALAEWAAMWALGWVIARRAMPGRQLIGSARGAIGENPGIWRFMLAANADATFGELSPRIAPLFVGWILGPIGAGLYAVGQRATTAIAQPAGNLGHASYAELARLLAAGGRPSELRHVVIRSIMLALAAAFPFFLIVSVFGEKLAVLIGGEGFRAAGTIMLWLIAARVVLLVAPSASAALVALGRPGLSVVANVICSLGLLPLLPVFLWRYGLGGAGLHAFLTSCAVALALGILTWRASAQTPLANFETKLTTSP